MWKIIQDLRSKGTTILLTTQYLEEADKLADKIAVIDHGVVIALGTADELKSKVGKNRLELNFVKLDDLVKAEHVIDNKNITVDKTEFSLSIHVENGAMEVKQVLDKLELAGIEIEGMSLHKPTLDDVFLNLTGHEVDKANLSIT